MSPRAGRTSVADVLAWLEATGTAKAAAGNARFGLPTEGVHGVPVGAMRAKAKAIGTDHALALGLWKNGAYEARMMAVFLADPKRLNRRTADAWCARFDNWAICDTACFHLFDRTDFAWDAPPDWTPDEREFVRRAGFALLWALAVHDKRAEDARFTDAFDLFRDASGDERPLVRKAVDMALRAIGKRGRALNAAARELAVELEASGDRTARWIGRHARRELESEKVRARIAKRR